jgi:hypothetical protein
MVGERAACQRPMNHWPAALGDRQLERAACLSSATPTSSLRSERLAQSITTLLLSLTYKIIMVRRHFIITECLPEPGQVS